MNNSIGWQSELDIALSVKDRIFLYGNIFDLYKFENQAYTLAGWLIKKLQKIGYQLIVGFDIIDDCCLLAGNSETYNAVRHHVYEDNRENQNENAKNVRIVRAQERNVADPTSLLSQLQAMRRILSNKTCPTALICQHTDKLVAHGQLNSTPDKMHSVIISKFTEETWYQHEYNNQVDHRQNLAIFIYDQEGLIPVEMHVKDTSAKVINIPYPNFETRSEFLQSHWEEFYGHDKLNKITEMTTTGDHDERKEIKQIKNYEGFARLTEGCTLRELYQLIKYSHSTRITLDRFSQLLSFFRSGKRENPWDAITGEHILQSTGFFENEVIGQTDAIQAVVDMLHRAKAELSRYGTRGLMKPRGILFFVGPTGVGKTLLARKLAHRLFGTEEACTVFDMSEYKEEHTISRLIGAPPGYIGHDTGGQLTNRIRERPFSVLLFDEIEKANPRIIDLFLQILESGRLTDGRGGTVSFSESIIIFTSNIGTRPNRKVLNLLRKEFPNESENALSPENLPQLSNETLKKYFIKAVEIYFGEKINRPELFNRLGNNVVVFHYLTLTDCLMISRRSIKDYFKRIKDRWYEESEGRSQFIIDSEELAIIDIQTAVLNRQDYRKYGGRGLENLIVSKLETPLASLFNRSNRNHNARCRISINQTNDTVAFSPLPEDQEVVNVIVDDLSIKMIYSGVNNFPETSGDELDKIKRQIAEKIDASL